MKEGRKPRPAVETFVRLRMEYENLLGVYQPSPHRTAHDRMQLRKELAEFEGGIDSENSILDGCGWKKPGLEASGTGIHIARNVQLEVERSEVFWVAHALLPDAWNV